MLAVVSCAATRWTLAVPLDWDGTRWSGTLRVPRTLVAANIRVEPRLVRTKTCQPTEVPRGTEIGDQLATGKGVDLHVDPMPFQSGDLRVSWVNFEKSDIAFLREHPTQLYFLQIAGPLPHLMLNSAHAKLQAALSSKGTLGTNAIIRHFGNAVIAQSVWLQLVLDACASIERPDDDQDPIEMPQQPWRRKLLERTLDFLHPGLERQEQLRALVQDRDNSFSTLVARAGSVAQERLRTPALVTKGIRAAELRRDS